MHPWSMKFPRLPTPTRLALALVATAVLGIGPAHADAYGDVNQMLRAGRPADAIAAADQYLSTTPKDPQMRFLKGVALTEARRAAEALELFQKLTEEYPELPEPYNNLAVLHAAEGRYDKARETLEMAIRANPGYATAHENLGDVYAQLASQSYARAQQLDAANATVRPKLALIRQLFASPGTRTSAAGQPPAR
jgi:Flp pilus assembly protein TadD